MKLGISSHGAVMAKKCTKTCNKSAKLLFCQSKPIAFMPFLLTWPSPLLKLPIVLCMTADTDTEVYMSTIK